MSFILKLSFHYTVKPVYLQIRSTYGTVNYRPTVTEEELEKIKLIRRELQVAPNNDAQEDYLELFLESYPLQRQDIVTWIEEGGEIAGLLGLWPLFCKRHTSWPISGI